MQNYHFKGLFNDQKVGMAIALRVVSSKNIGDKPKK